jgi:hypothetical protein
MSTKNSESPSLSQVATETAQAFGPHAAQLEIAEKAVLIDDMRRLAADERDTVARYREKTVFNRDPGERKDVDEEMGNIIITGDIYGRDVAKGVFGEFKEGGTPAEPRPTEPTPPPPTPPAQNNSNGAWKKLLAAGLLGSGVTLGGTLIGAGLMGGDKDTDTDTNTRYELGGDWEQVGE